MFLFTPMRHGFPTNYTTSPKHRTQVSLPLTPTQNVLSYHQNSMALLPLTMSPFIRENNSQERNIHVTRIDFESISVAIEINIYTAAALPESEGWAFVSAGILIKIIVFNVDTPPIFRLL